MVVEYVRIIDQSHTITEVVNVELTLAAVGWLATDTFFLTKLI